MTRKLTLLMPVFIFSLLFVCAQQMAAQTRKSVGAAEVNGTFRSYFSGKFKSSFDEIQILALGGGKLKVSFELLYPFVDGTGELSANMGEAQGEAIIDGDTAVYT